MGKCLYCYKELDAGAVGDYHAKCIKAFFGTTEAPILPYRLSDMEQLAKEAALLSVTVPGVQPKLSLGFIRGKLADGHRNRLTIMNALKGHFIMKPPNPKYDQMPENEHLTMKLAELFRIDVVPSGLIRMASGELCYLTKRIDRDEKGSRIHMIDFLQILELEDKYRGTMERLGTAIGELSVNTLLDKLRFFELTIFSYITGNNDMHLKNFSMWLTETGWMLSPAYDLLNVKMILPGDHEDMALLLEGKKENFSKASFDRFGEVLKLNKKQVNSVYRRLGKWLPTAEELIGKSLLSEERKIAYRELINSRAVIFYQ